MFSFWRRGPGFWQNFIAGLLIIGALLSLDGLPVVKSWENWAVDTMIRLNSTLARMSGKRHERQDLQFTFLDMDERSYQDPRWNEPFHVPRDKLLKLIQFAVKGKASLIVVDVVLGKKSADGEADKALVDYISNYPRSAPPLILMRTKRVINPGDKPTHGEFRKTIFAGIEQPNVHFAQPMFQRDKKDGMVRSWILLDKGCLEGQGITLPSVQLLAYALLRDRREGGSENLIDLHASMNANRPIGCEVGEKVKTIRRPVIIGKTVFRHQKFGERLIYSIPWPKSGKESHDLLSYPAFFVTDGPKGGTPSKTYSVVENRITLIGASYGASHDLHQTPLGMMPGTLIILNAIKSLSLFDQITPPHLFVRLAFLLTFITILSYVFSKYSNLVKLLIVSALVFFFFVPISFWLFKYGVWFDFGILLLGIKLQHTLSEFLEVRELKRQVKMKNIARDPVTQSDSSAQSASRSAEQVESGDVEVRVHLKRKPDGRYLVNAAPIGQPGTQFEVAANGLKAKAGGFVLDLKRHEPPS